ncbi:MAG: shikimate dehydrogenase [Alphaproteobacteria bacterium]|nr:shikimate dehydrogenase [Alphaproteobacteria bacterium]
MLSGKARIAGIIGWPVSHSRSPRLHGHWLQRHGIDGAYVPLAVRPNHAEHAIRTLPLLGFAGANVTVPHKQTALMAADRVDSVARRIGAVNTLVVEPDGTLHGSNTDAHGFLANLQEGAPRWRAKDGPAVVLGAGGAARAVIAALVDAGVPAVRIVNRSLERAESVAADIGGPIHVIPWADRAIALGEAALLVNTTTLGMSGQPELDLDLDGLPPGAVVNDIVYVPLETALLAEARRRGHAVVDGLGMLLHQARPGFAAWFGVDPVVDEELRRAVLGG